LGEGRVARACPRGLFVPDSTAPLVDSLHSVLDPHGPAAVDTAEIALVLFVGATLIFVVVMALAVWATFGDRRDWLAGHGAVVAGGIVLPAVVLFALLVYTLLVAARIGEPYDRPLLRIDVFGELWWWRVHYLDDAGVIDFATANEIHIPVDTTVELTLRSTNVLHSVWVPALAGKLDMVPGKVNRLRLRASRAGVYRGQCAEYCGAAHAQMALYVVAGDETGFERWRDLQRRPAAGGHPLFLAHCASCHAIRGTAAAGVLGPDLTHVGGRLSIGAGALPGSVEALGRWIASSQHIKPGNLMPEFRSFDGAELRALADYLAGLE
jgi:cytochrome c oxidase subunit 2